MRVETSPVYGAGIDLLDPQVHVRLIEVPISEENPGARSDWTLYPSWHCIVYASGKRGTGRESVVSEAAKFLLACRHRRGWDIGPASSGLQVREIILRPR
jgi:hypothetical protein